MSAAARPLNYFDTVSNGVAPRQSERRSQTEILRGSAPAPVVREYMHVGSVQRATERRMRHTQAQAAAVLTAKTPRNIRINTYEANAHAHDTYEHVSYFRLASIDTDYNGQKCRVVLSCANAPCYPYFREDGQQRLKDFHSSINNDKVKQPLMYWGHIEDMNGKPITTSFKDALVFRTTDFNEVIQKCIAIAPRPTASVNRGAVMETPRPAMQSRGMAYAS
jgi:hypothetical protein